MKIKLIIGLCITLLLVSCVTSNMDPGLWYKNPDELGYTVRLGLNKGWNLVPATFNIHKKFSNSGYNNIEKEDIKSMFYYSSISKKYYKIYPELKISEAKENDKAYLDADVENYIKTSAVWLYSEKMGKLEYYITIEDKELLNKRELFEGWNFIIISPEMENKALKDIKGTCDIEKIAKYQGGRWKILTPANIKNSKDPKLQGTWDEIILSIADSGEGFLMKVSDDCKLNVKGIRTPPDLPN